MILSIQYDQYDQYDQFDQFDQFDQYDQYDSNDHSTHIHLKVRYEIFKNCFLLLLSQYCQSTSKRCLEVATRLMRYLNKPVLRLLLCYEDQFVLCMRSVQLRELNFLT